MNVELVYVYFDEEKWECAGETYKEAYKKAYEKAQEFMSQLRSEEEFFDFELTISNIDRC